MTLQHFLRNATLTTQGPTFPIFVISYLLLFISYYLYTLCDLGSYSNHYAFLYHSLVLAPLIAVPFALSVIERRRFEDLGYRFRWNKEAVGICIGYGLVTSVSGAYIKVSMAWLGLMGVNLVPLWFAARPQNPRRLTRKEGCGSLSSVE
jgi:hypothetical protein